MVLQDVLSVTLASMSPIPSPPSFHFEWSADVAQHNLDVLCQHDMDLDKAIQAQPFCGITFRSEFHPILVLEPLCGRHPLWPCMCQYLMDCMACPMLPLAETDRLHDL